MPHFQALGMISEVLSEIWDCLSVFPIHVLLSGSVFLWEGATSDWILRLADWLVVVTAQVACPTVPGMGQTTARLATVVLSHRLTPGRAVISGGTCRSSWMGEKYMHKNQTIPIIHKCAFLHIFWSLSFCPSNVFRGVSVQPTSGSSWCF